MTFPLPPSNPTLGLIRPKRPCSPNEEHTWHLQQQELSTARLEGTGKACYMQDVLTTAQTCCPDYEWWSGREQAVIKARLLPVGWLPKNIPSPMPCVQTCHLHSLKSPNARSQGLHRGRRTDTILTKIQDSGLEETTTQGKWELNYRLATGWHQGFSFLKTIRDGNGVERKEYF